MNTRQPMPDPGRLHALRRQVAQIETREALRSRGEQTLALGIEEFDAVLGGGLALTAVHEISPAAPVHGGAAVGFSLALAALAVRHRHALWIQQDCAAFEFGHPYGPGLALFGLPMSQVIILRVPKARDALWAMEEALKSGAVSVVLTELTKDADQLTATRRLSLAAMEGRTLGLILRHHAGDHPSAAATRWRVAAAAGQRDEFGGLGPAAFILSLVKNRRGPLGQWLLSWDHHARAFVAAVSLGVAQAARDRSGRVPLMRAG